MTVREQISAIHYYFTPRMEKSRHHLDGGGATRAA